MPKEWLDGVGRAAVSGWSNLDTDWRGVLVAAAILALVWGLGIDVAW